MKYGQTLHQRSLPKWRHQNVDYNDIKLLIKERTISGNGQAVTIPGRDEVTQNFEDELYRILFDEKERIELFVKNKAGEISRRLDNLSAQAGKLGREKSLFEPQRLNARQLRYYKLEGRVIQAGDELRSLSRFTIAQEIAFRKLLKKYKRWTGSSGLDRRFKPFILRNSGNPLGVDFDSLVAQWTEVLQVIRMSFQLENRAGAPSPLCPSAHAAYPQSTRNESSASQTTADGSLLAAAVEKRSMLEFDAIFSAPSLESSGEVASYWIHPDNLRETQIFLHQRSNAIHFSSAGSSKASSPSSERRHSSPLASDHDLSFSFRGETVGGLILTKRDEVPSNSEHVSAPHIINARWNGSGEAVVSLTVDAIDQNAPSYLAHVKRKHLGSFLDTSNAWESRRSSLADSVISIKDGDDSSNRVRSWLSEHPNYEPMVSISSQRLRFTSSSDETRTTAWAALDCDIRMRPATLEAVSASDFFDSQGADTKPFTFALLEIQSFGTARPALIDELDQSHLVHRVDGFDMATHALWTCYKSPNTTAPRWASLMETDIRRLPPLQESEKRRNPSSAGQSSETMTPDLTSASMTPAAFSTESESTVSQRLARKTKRSAAAGSAPKSGRYKHWAEVSTGTTSNEEPHVHQAKYWNEYDDPDDVEDDAYYVYIDPNEPSLFDKLINHLWPWRSSPPTDKSRGLFTPTEIDTDDDGSETSDERAYGTFSPSGERPGKRRSQPSFLPCLLGRADRRARSQSQIQPDLESNLDEFGYKLDVDRWRSSIASFSLASAAVILIITVVLAMTGKRKAKQKAKVDAGFVLGIVASLVLACTGVGAILSGYHPPGRRLAVSTGIGFVAICLGNGILLAWLVS